MHELRTNEWQPIETAPKDGTSILVYDPHCGDNPPIFMAEWIEDWGCFAISNDGQRLDPTHWMPLPPPPPSKSDLARIDRMKDEDIDIPTSRRLMSQAVTE